MNFASILEVKIEPKFNTNLCLFFIILLDAFLMDVRWIVELLLELFWPKSRSDPETCKCKDCMVITIRNEGPTLQQSVKIE